MLPSPFSRRTLLLTTKRSLPVGSQSSLPKYRFSLKCHACRPQLCQGARRQLRHDVRRHVAPDVDRDRRVVALALVGDEEMHGVWDDRSAEREPEFLVLGRRLDVRIAVELSGCLGPVMVAGVGAEDLALEVIGAGGGLASYRGP